MKPLFRRGLRVLHRFLGGLSLCCLLVLAGCDRRDITYYLDAEIELFTDWSEAQLNEPDYGATAIFYPRNGSKPQVVLMGTRTHQKVRLPEGVYDVVVFNRSFDDFGGVAFYGETFDEFVAYAKRVETRLDEQTRTTTRVIVATPEKIAADVRMGYEVTEAMLGNYSPEAVLNRGKTKSDEGIRPAADDPYTIFLAPAPMTRKVEVMVHAQGVHNIRSAVGLLDGVSEAITLCTGLNTGSTVTQQFGFTDIVFVDGSPFDGYITGAFNVFGFSLAGTHKLVLKALLVDGKTIVEQAFDATARELPDADGVTRIYIEVTAPKMPDVKPEGGADSGFDASVDEWGDPEEVEIPLGG